MNQDQRKAAMDAMVAIAVLMTNPDTTKAQAVMLDQAGSLVADAMLTARDRVAISTAIKAIDDEQERGGRAEPAEA